MVAAMAVMDTMVVDTVAEDIGLATALGVVEAEEHTVVAVVVDLAVVWDEVVVDVAAVVAEVVEAEAVVKNYF
jgi:hypothetical protein